MDIIKKLVKCQGRKLVNLRPMVVTLNRKHQEQLEKWLRKADLKLDDLKCLAGYKIMGMIIKTKLN